MVLEEIGHRHPDIFGNLSQQNGRNVPTLMKRDGSDTTTRMSKLFMGAPLAHF